MPLLHGKQITDTSIILNKLSGTGSLVLQTGATFQVPTANINVATDIVNKEYVDSVASGLDPKESVYLVAVSNITTNGTASIDGVTASVGKRVLLTAQTSAVNNGIYVVGSTAWSRASDSDGNPGNEVSLGNFTFVERGTTYSSLGYVLYDTNATGATVSPGTDTQLWTQFSNAGSFTWGDGLANTGNNIYVDIASNSGLTFSSAQLTINPTIAGNGLAWTSGVLSVNTANGLQIVADNVEIAPTVAGLGLTFSSGVIDINVGTGITISGDAVTLANTTIVAGSYGAANSINTFTVNAQGQLTTAATVSISITSGQVTNFTASVQSLASNTTAGPGISVVQSGGSATVSLSPLGSTSSYGSANTINTFTYNNYGQITTAATVSISIPSGQVTNFTASAISSALASANFVDSTTIDFTANGATVSAVIVPGSLTASLLNTGGAGATAGYVLSVAANGQFVWIDSTAVGDITGVTAGIGLTGGGTSGFVTLDVRATNGLTADATSDSVELGGTLTKDTTIVGGAFAYTQSSTSTIDSYYGVGGQTNSVSITSTGVTIKDNNTSTGRVQEFNTSVSNTSATMRSYDASRTASVVAQLTDIVVSSGTTNIKLRTSTDQTIGDGSTNNRMIVTDSVNSKGLVYAGDYTAAFTTYSLITKGYVDAISAGLGDITGVTAGDGLSGGGASGYVTLDVNTGVGITISSDAVTLTNTAVTAASYGAAGTVGTFTVDAQGRLTAAADVLISIPSGQVNNFTSSVTTIVGSPVYSQRNQTPVATTGNGASSSLTITSTPNDFEHVSVYVNGQLQFLGNGTTASVDCYFGTQSATAVTIANITSGNTLFWNGTYVGFSLSTTDKVDFIYNA